MARGDLRDDQWEKLEPSLPKPGRGRRGRPCERNREVINGIMWIHRTGSPWDDMPRALYGSSDTAYSRFNRWSKEGIWKDICLKLIEICDEEQLPLIVDSSIIKAHPDASGAKKKIELKLEDIPGKLPSDPEKAEKKRKREEIKVNQKEESLGRCVGGLSTKIHLACAGKSKPLSFVLSGGEAHDSTMFSKLMAKILGLLKYFEVVIADKAYDSDDIRDFIESQGKTPVIPPRDNRLYKEDYDYDRELYRQRNQIERLLGHMKRRSRRVATRYEKLDVCYSGMVAISCLLCWL